jgi:DnaJ family protein C protein 13
VFIRVYNGDPSFKLDRAEDFIRELICYLSSVDLTDSSSSGSASLILEALSNAVKSNPGSECLCKGKFRLLSSFLMSAQFERPTLTLLTTLMSSQDCVSDIVGMGVVPALLVCCGRSTSTETTLSSLTCLGMMVAHPQVVKESLSKGAIVYLLSLFVNDRIDPVIRQKSAELLSRLCADKLSGPRVKILVTKFLPQIFPEAMEESGPSAVQLFDSTTENPEIVWTDEMRSRVRSEVTQIKNDLISNQSRDLSYDLKLGESYRVNYDNEELVVGGIYLRLYVANQSWNIRKPREFLRDLLDHAFTPTSSSAKTPDEVDLIGSALGYLLSSHGYLADSLPAMGYTSKILSNCGARLNALILVNIARNPSCVDSLCQVESIKFIVRGLKEEDNANVPLLCEALNGLYSHGRSELVAQAVKFELVQVLLDLLRRQDSGVKANIVHCLQAMQQDDKFGMDVRNVLDTSPTWAQYRDQVTPFNYFIQLVMMNNVTICLCRSTTCS